MKSSITCIFGKRGSGKSTLARAQILELLDERVHLVIYDPLMAEHARALEGHGFQSAKTLRGFIDLVNMHYDRGTPWLRLCFSPDGSDCADGDRAKHFECLASIVKEWERVLFVVEEADMFMQAGHISPALGWMVNYGRHKEQSIMALSRRHTCIARELTAQADRIFTFKQTEPRDISYLEELGFNGAKVRNLKDYKFIELDL